MEFGPAKKSKLHPRVKYGIEIVGYTSLGLLAVGLPLWGLIAGADRALWGAVLAVTLSVTLFICWLYRPGFDLPGKSIYRGLRGGRRIALTFDDGPNGPSTEAILDVLARHGARATFFCVGRAAAAQPHILQRMVREGHVVANHSQDHRRFAWMSRAELAHQLDAAQESIRQAGAPAPVWFRAPHGVKSPMLRGMLAERGLRLCAWSHDIRDFECPGADTLVRRAASGLKDGEIVLMHDGGGDRLQTAAALDRILGECERRGLRPVTIAEIMSPP